VNILKISEFAINKILSKTDRSLEHIISIQKKALEEKKNIYNINPNWSITLSDFSAGMLQSAKDGHFYETFFPG